MASSKIEENLSSFRKIDDLVLISATNSFK